MDSDSTAYGESDAASCSPLADALALVDFGACRDSGSPAKWINVASPMCAHCIGSEDVNLAAARIIAAELAAVRHKLEAIKCKAVEALRISWLYSGKDVVMGILREIEEISSGNACRSHGEESATPTPNKQ